MFAQLGDVPFELLNSFTDLEETHEAQCCRADRGCRRWATR